MAELEQNSTYKPTKAEERLLEVLANPEYKQKNVSEICGIAEIDRKTYYTAFKKPGFVDYYHQLSIELVKQSVMPVLNAVRKEAQGGSFQHAKLLLEMAGLYTEKKQQEITGANGGPLQFEQILSELE